ncbi:type II CRISPR RNA-guided endonuclease Cas9 [Nesterenkonia alkaliphila]|uniref:HNH Cas9-type domain-containing protein n=1 Tax=Nesterenkonia alkaliphila TaxID=1463631 RepID=A0A7K1UER3_9MICC|nr:type II CRISPR RNA-guided endonuclease Cas9 [Nesterenkonia alkaliphila]MVT24912.1 hypothetical protein [Nesterenkonia alkaliphila]GFZ86672.1 hypothetical protein GCM10011359_14620 [Nesterenkonia alkaliphila]
MIRVEKPKDRPCKYRIGIDVGQRGIGLAAIELDDDGFPIQLLSALTHRMDGGILPGTEKSPESRKAKAGLARRVRRMRKYRKQRLQKLDNKLRELGYPIIDGPATYEPWQARTRLVEGRITDQEQLKADLSMALRHIARHRGWRNPWLTWNTFCELPVPSNNHKKNIDAARERFGRDFPEDFTVGQLGALGNDPTIVIRPRKSKNSRTQTAGELPLFEHKLLQEDQLAEVEKYWDIQDLPADDRDSLIRVVFHQEKPRVPQENVGKDELPGMTQFYRAPRASLEFQEFRIRAAVANLGIRGGRGFRKLTDEEYDAATKLLLNWHKSHLPTETPVWADVAECLDVSPRALKTNALDDVVGNNPPINRTLDLLEYGIDQLPAKAKKPIKKWFAEADAELIQAFVSWLIDTTDGQDELFAQTGLDDVVTEWDETALEKLASIELENGRAAYSTQSLKRLNARMAGHREGLHEARKAVFGVDDTWKPTPPSLDERTEHPTVDQNLTAIRRFLLGCVQNWGLPEQVNLEHVRSAFMGAAALEEYRREQRKILSDREKAREALRGVLSHEPTRRDARRHEYVQRQNSQCAYCGTTIDAKSCELDHIVPRAGGGASTRANLVAVCRGCNQDKGRVPFAAWASRTQREGVSVDEAIARVKGWLGRGANASERKINRETIQRLRQGEEDEPLDERSMESTAYAARALRERIQKFLTDAAAQLGVAAPTANVYRGSVVSAARKASGIDSMIHLRGKDIKDRGDFRHHAVDAAVVSLMNHAVGQVLAIRDNMRNTAFWVGEQEWEKGWQRLYGERQSFLEWKLRAQRLGEVIRDAIRNDEIAVINPLRLGRNVGPVHEDTVRTLKSKSLHTEWSAKDVQRIVDPKIYLLVKKELEGTKAPQFLSEALVGNLTRRVGGEILTFPSDSAQLPVRGGAVELGSVHHARIYAWKNKKGAIELGILRVFAGEIAKMWPNPKVDLLTAAVPEWSMSRRDVQTKTEAALSSGIARQVGWIAPGDEIEVDVSMAAQGKDKFASFLRSTPEHRWTVSGLKMSRIISLRPLFLSSEGLDNNSDPLLREVVERTLVNPGVVLPLVKIVRRDALGRPRHFSRHLPHSFSPMEEAKRLLG